MSGYSGTVTVIAYTEDDMLQLSHRLRSIGPIPKCTRKKYLKYLQYLLLLSVRTVLRFRADYGLLDSLSWSMRHLHDQFDP